MNTCQRLISSSTSSGTNEALFPKHICKIRLLSANTNTKTFKLNYFKTLFSLCTFKNFPLQFPEQSDFMKRVQTHFITILKSLLAEIDQQIDQEITGGTHQMIEQALFLQKTRE